MSIIKGTRRADTIYGSDESDYILGAKGADTLFGYGGLDTLRGGNGNDYVDGSGGGQQFTALWQNLSTMLDGTLLYGGNGRDWLETEMFGRSQTFQEGGAGADTFSVLAEQFSWEGDNPDQNRVDINDFGKGDDKLNVRLWHGGEDYVDAKDVFAGLDTNHDGVIDGNDPAGAMGFTWSDANANAVCLVVGDGDLIAVHGVTALTVDMIYG